MAKIPMHPVGKGEVLGKVDSLFALLDINGDGTLTCAEVVENCHLLKITAEEANKLFNKLDKDGNGELGIKEFAKAAKLLAIKKKAIAMKTKKAQEDGAKVGAGSPLKDRSPVKQQIAEVAKAHEKPADTKPSQNVTPPRPKAEETNSHAKSSDVNSPEKTSPSLGDGCRGGGRSGGRSGGRGGGLDRPPSTTQPSKPRAQGTQAVTILEVPKLATKVSKANVQETPPRRETLKKALPVVVSPGASSGIVSKAEKLAIMKQKAAALKQQKEDAAKGLFSPEDVKKAKLAEMKDKALALKAKREDENRLRAAAAAVNAALVLQQAARRHRARKTLGAKRKEKQTAEVNDAAAKLQSVARQRGAKRTSMLLRQEKVAEKSLAPARQLIASAGSLNPLLEVRLVCADDASSSKGKGGSWRDQAVRFFFDRVELCAPGAGKKVAQAKSSLPLNHLTVVDFERDAASSSQACVIRSRSDEGSAEEVVKFQVEAVDAASTMVRDIVMVHSRLNKERIVEAGLVDSLSRAHRADLEKWCSSLQGMLGDGDGSTGALLSPGLRGSLREATSLLKSINKKQGMWQEETTAKLEALLAVRDSPDLEGIKATWLEASEGVVLHGDLMLVTSNDDLLKRATVRVARLEREESAAAQLTTGMKRDNRADLEAGVAAVEALRAEEPISNRLGALTRQCTARVEEIKVSQAKWIEKQEAKLEAALKGSDLLSMRAAQKRSILGVNLNGDSISLSHRVDLLRRASDRVERLVHEESLLTSTGEQLAAAKSGDNRAELESSIAAAEALSVDELGFEKLSELIKACAVKLENIRGAQHAWRAKMEEDIGAAIKGFDGARIRNVLVHAVEGVHMNGDHVSLENREDLLERARARVAHFSREEKVLSQILSAKNSDLRSDLVQCIDEATSLRFAHALSPKLERAVKECASRVAEIEGVQAAWQKEAESKLSKQVKEGSLKALLAAIKISTDGVKLHGDNIALEGCEELLKRAADRVSRLEAESGLVGLLEAAVESNARSTMAESIEAAQRAKVEGPLTSEVQKQLRLCVARMDAIVAAQGSWKQHTKQLLHQAIQGIDAAAVTKALGVASSGVDMHGDRVTLCGEFDAVLELGAARVSRLTTERLLAEKLAAVAQSGGHDALLEGIAEATALSSESSPFPLTPSLVAALEACRGKLMDLEGGAATRLQGLVRQKNAKKAVGAKKDEKVRSLRDEFEADLEAALAGFDIEALEAARYIASERAASATDDYLLAMQEVLFERVDARMAQLRAFEELTARICAALETDSLAELSRCVDDALNLEAPWPTHLDEKVTESIARVDAEEARGVTYSSLAAAIAGFDLAALQSAMDEAHRSAELITDTEELETHRGLVASAKARALQLREFDKLSRRIATALANGVREDVNEVEGLASALQEQHGPLPPALAEQVATCAATVEEMENDQAEWMVAAEAALETALAGCDLEALAAALELATFGATVHGEQLALSDDDLLTRGAARAARLTQEAALVAKSSAAATAAASRSTASSALREEISSCLAEGAALASEYPGAPCAPATEAALASCRQALAALEGAAAVRLQGLARQRAAAATMRGLRSVRGAHVAAATAIQCLARRRGAARAVAARRGAKVARAKVDADLEALSTALRAAIASGATGALQRVILQGGRVEEALTCVGELGLPMVVERMLTSAKNQVFKSFGVECQGFRDIGLWVVAWCLFMVSVVLAHRLLLA